MTTDGCFLVTEIARQQRARPVLKWAGGKTKLLPVLLRHLPPAWLAPPYLGAYLEPFLGGGALFFALEPRYAIVGDACEELITTYQGVRDDVEGVIQRLETFEKAHTRDFFDKLRADVAVGSAVFTAVRMIYLNKTCFNGLYRVNRQGKFNVPFGDYANPKICDEEGLRRASEALAGAQLAHQDFAVTLREAKRGDLVYCDPPYPPASKTANFASYTADKFGPKEHERLAGEFGCLAERGAYGMLSIADVSMARGLYAGRYRLVEVEAPRAISCKGEGRKKVPELIVMNYTKEGELLRC